MAALVSMAYNKAWVMIQSACKMIVKTEFPPFPQRSITVRARYHISCLSSLLGTRRKYHVLPFFSISLVQTVPSKCRRHQLAPKMVYIQNSTIFTLAFTLNVSFCSHICTKCCLWSRIWSHQFGQCILPWT